MAERYPKYIQIKETLLRGISSGRFKDLLPSENELAERFKVSRMTARKGLSELVKENYAVRIPGKGTFVKKQRFAQGVFRVLPFKKYAEEINVSPATRVLEVGIKETPLNIAEKLGCSKAIMVRRLHYFDEKPVRYEKRWLRVDMCGDLIWEDLSVESINDILINKMNLPLTKAWQRLEAVILPVEVAKYFELTGETAAFRMERLTYTFDNPVTHVEYYLRGDSFTFEDTFLPQQDAGS